MVPGGLGRWLLLTAAVVMAASGCGAGAEDSASPSTKGCYDAGMEPADPDCPTWEEQRSLNMRYADRLPFEGDETEAAKVVEEVRAALTVLAATSPDPTLDELTAALAPWDRSDTSSIQTSSNAVRMSGSAFAISVAGGCVFGAVNAGEVTVETGGHINDGGCLASYGH